MSWFGRVIAGICTAGGIALALGTGLAPALGQDEAAVERALEQYRRMMKEDPWANPANLDADRGEALRTTKAGPKGVSLEGCGSWRRTGKVDGALAELPRYFADADRVMDVETRLLWCRKTLQGIDDTEYLKNPHPANGQPVEDVGAMATWISSQVERPDVHCEDAEAEGEGGGRARRGVVQPAHGADGFCLRDVPRREG